MEWAFEVQDELFVYLVGRIPPFLESVEATIAVASEQALK